MEGERKSGGREEEWSWKEGREGDKGESGDGVWVALFPGCYSHHHCLPLYLHIADMAWK